MDEQREEREELAELERDEADEVREQEAARRFWDEQAAQYGRERYAEEADAGR